MSPSPWRLAARTERMNPSVIREILKLTELPGIISLAGGLPSPDTFPVEAMRAATARVLRDNPREALQYAASEGYAPLREWVAAEMSGRGVAVDAAAGADHDRLAAGLDLVGKALIDRGSRVAVESPTYLGALQAFTPYEPELVAIACDDEGAAARGARRRRPRRALPLRAAELPEPSGRSIGAPRRVAIAASARDAGLPIVEDNPYGDLWYDAEPAAPIASLWREGTIYLGSFSKVLAPGLRLGYVVAPAEVMPKLLQAKQASDLHTPSLNQRLVHEVVKDGFLREHVPTIRKRYKAQRDAMQAALAAHLPQSGPRGCRWQVPGGGMFFWLELPQDVDAEALLPRAVERGVAFVPGAPFFAGAARKNTLRLSFVTVAPEAIERGVRALAAALEATP
jgi:2-aminoadipate transaminase